MILAILMAGAAVQDFPAPYMAFGWGGQSCATALEIQDQHQLDEWVAGFFSGVNAARGGRVGSGTDLSGLTAEVRLVCRQEPSKALTWAAQQAYRKLRASGFD